MKNLYTAFLCILGVLFATTQSQALGFSSITGNTIGSDQTICNNTTPAPLTGSVPGGGTGVYTYQWQVSSTSAIAGFASIAGGTAQGYTPGVLVANRWYRRIVISGIEQDTTSAVTITVTPIITAGSNTITAAQSICFNNIPGALNGSTPTGGNGVYSYQWQSSPDNITFTSIVGATGLGFAPGALAANTWFRRIVNSGGCSLTSASIKITVTPVITPGSNTISTVDQSVCSGQTPTALPGSTPTGGNGAYNFLWESSTTSATTGFSLAPGVANNKNYQPAALTQTTWFHRLAISLGCVDTSTAVMITVVSSPPGNPAVYGNGVWDVYGYADNAFGTYAGFYTEPVLSFNTISRYTNTQSPSAASGYQGCQIPPANFSASMKQTNFTPGNYQINLNSLDDNLNAYLNGTQIYAHTCCVAAPINNIWTGFLGTTDQMDLRWVEFGTPSYLSLAFVPVTPAPLVPGSISQDMSVCFGEAPASGFTSLAPATTGCTFSGYQWQKSIDSVTWVNIAGATALIYTEGAALTQTTWYRRMANDACLNAVPTSPVKITVNVTPPGNPAVSGNNVWNVYVFQGTAPFSSATYKGWYTEPLLSFDSRNRWPNGGSPSVASGYQGCYVAPTNHWVDYKRTNFTPAIYQVDIPAHDDDAYLFINGIQVFVHNGCCDSHTNVWTGPLGATDVVEFRVSQGGGGAYQALTLTPVTPPALTSGAITPSQTICAGNVPPIPFTESIAPTGGCTIKNYLWEYSTDNGVTWTSVSGAIAISYTVTSSIFSQTLYRRTVNDVCGNSAVSVPDTIYMNNSAPGNPAVFGNNVWNVYCFQDINYSLYAGYYTEPLLTFSTPNRYPATSPPSTASGYLGCQLINTYYSVSMKRTGFTAGLYQIDVTSDDDYNLIYINGVLVSSLTFPTLQNNVWTGNLGPTDQIEVRWRNNAGPGQTGVRFTLVTPPPLVAGSIVASNPNLCFNDLPIITEVTPASGGCFVNYSWQTSTDGGTTWVTVAGATGNSYTATVSPTTNIQYRRVATDVCGAVAYTVPVSFIQTAGTVGNPAVYGNGVWNVYAYDAMGAAFTTAQYLGYYVEPLLSFDSRNRWGSNNAPSDASGYQGCQVDQDNHWVSYRQTNFIPGTYQIDVATHDDDGYLFVNGVQVWSHVGGCCDAHPNVWTGTLGATDQVEFRWREFFGGSNGALNFTLVTPVTTVNPGTIAAGQTICVNTVPAAFTSTLDASSSCFVSYQWQNSPDNATWTDIAGATSNIYASGAVAAKTYFRRKATNACGVIAYSNTIIVDVYPAALSGGSVATDQTICGSAVPSSLTSTGLPTGGDGVYVYQWQSSLDNIGWSNIALATAATYAPGALGVTTYFRRKVTACGAAASALSNFVTITVNALPAITVQPVNSSACVGGNTLFSVTATGAGLTYQWQVSTGGPFTNVVNGSPYSGATTATLLINPMAGPLNNNQYRVIVSGTCAPAVTSNAATLTINNNPVVTGPVNTSVCAGSNGTFSVSASGTGLTYQWQQKIGAGAFTNLVDGGVYGGSLTSVLTLTGVPVGMNGYFFRCIVTSSCGGNATSAQATLTVVAAIVNTISADQTICTGSNAANLTGSTNGAYTYLWQTSTVSAVAGFVTASGVNNGSGYAPNPVSTTTYYRRIVNNGSCSGTSPVVTITLNNTPIAITTQPVAQTICAGSVANFTVVATGPGALSYQWYENNGVTTTPIVDGGIYSGSLTPSLTLTGVTLGMNNYKYSVIVFASGCSASSQTSASAILTTNSGPAITVNTADFTTCQGSSVAINVTATGLGLGYQWQFNSGSGWNNLSNFGSYSNVNGNSLRINPTLASMNGYQYRCVVTGTCSPFTVNSAITTMTVNGPVANNSISNSQTLCAGVPVPFTGSAPTGGNGVYAYQWYQNGVLIPGATGINYAPGLITTTSTFFRQVTSGACGANNSQPITVTILPPTSTTDPVNATVCASTNISFSVTGTGSGLSYQWQVNTGSGWNNVTNGASYTGATAATLNVLAPPVTANGYQYRCVISGNCAPISVNSNAATLTVNPIANITGQPTNVISCQGSTVSFQVTATGVGLSYQWMEKVGAGTFTNITNGGIYGGANSSILTLTGITTAMNTNQYQCVITIGGCPVSSVSASLNVNAQPALVITNPATVCAPSTVDITAPAITAGSNLAGGSLSYWNDITFTSPIASPASISLSGTYYIRVAVSVACYDIKPVVVTINPSITNNTVSAAQSICTGSAPAGLTGGIPGGGTGSFTYQWQQSTDNISYTDIGGAVNPNYSPGALVTSTWYRRVLNSGVCANTSPPVKITVVAYPTATISYSGTPYCATGTATVTQTGQTGGTYTALPAGLSLNAVTGAINLAASTANTYTVTYSFSNGTCNATTTAPITVAPIPTVVITNPAAVCAPATVDLTAAAVTAGSTAGLTYSYYTNAVGTVVLAIPNAVATSGTYYIKGTTPGGCVSAVMPVVVTVTPVPTVVITNPAAVCAPATVDLTAAAVTAGSTPGLTYSYYTNAAGTIALATPAAVAASGTYYIKGTTLGGCVSAVMPVVVTVTPVPTIVITNPAAVCAPATVDLTAAAVTAGSTAGLTYTYFTNAAGTIALATPAAVAASGTYYIKGTTLGGCVSAVMPVVVTVTPVPTLVITNPAAVCAPATVDLTAAAVTAGSTAGLTYTYFTNAAGTIALATPAAVATSGTYYIKGTTLGGCVSLVMPVMVTVTPVPTVVITNPAAVCAPATVDLTATAVTAGSTPGLTYSYYTNAAGTVVLATPSAVATSGTYYIKGTTPGGCSSAVMPVVVTVTPIPTVVITNPAAVCAPATVDLTAAAVTAGSTAGLTYTYFTNAAGTIALATPNAVATSGTYYIKGTTLGGCTSAVTPVVVTVTPVPTVVITNPAAVCALATVDITAAAVTAGSTPGLTYSYYTNAAGTVVLAAPNAVATSGTYYIKGITLGGCASAVTPVVVTVTPVPTVVITNPAAVCAPATVDLTAAAVTAGSTAGLTYTYFTNAAGTIALVTPAAVATSGTYYIKGTTLGGCVSAVMPVVVTVTPVPTVVITNPAAVCAPATVDLTAAAVTAGSTAGLTFTYFTNAAGTIALAIPSAVTTSGTYYIKGTTLGGCVSAVMPVVVTVTPVPTVVITNPPAVCAPATVDLTAAAVTAGSTPGLTYSYYTNAAGTVVLATPSAVATSGTYYIKGTTLGGCASAVMPVVVTVTPVPTVVITNPAAVCAPATVDITAAAVTAGSTAGLTYTYYTNAAGTIALATPNAVATSGTYYIKGTTPGGCVSAVMPVVVTVTPVPTVVITNPPAVCAPATVDLTAAAVTAGSTAGLTYTYFTNAPGTIALATPNAVSTSGTYYIKGTTLGGCVSAVMPVVVTITPVPTVVIANPAAVCAPATVDLTAASVTAGSTAGLTYSYFTNAAGTVVLATPNAVTTSGTYYIKGTTLGGCTSAVMPVVVTITPVPTVVITNPAAVCAPATVDLTAAAVTAGSTAGLTYSYYTNAAGTVVLAAPNAVATSGTYYIKGTTAGGCVSAVMPVVVTVTPVPTVVITNPAAVCAPATVDLTATAVTAGSTPGLTYSYYTNAAGTVILATPNAVTTSGTYYIKGTTLGGCASAVMPVLVAVTPVPTVVITNPAAVCAPATVDLTAAAVTAGSTPGLTYSYYTNAAGTVVLATPSAVATSGTYYIKGTTLGGCVSAVVPVVVTVTPVPTVVITNPAAVCAPATVDLTAAAVTAGSTAGLTFTYFTDAAGTIALATPNAITTSGNYYIKGTTLGGCASAVMPVVVTVTPVPTVVITNPAAVCAPATVDLTATAVTAGSTAGLTFTYFTDAAGTIALATPNAITTSGTYYIKGTTLGGCASAVMPVVVTVTPVPTVVITNPAAVCAPAIVDLTATAVTAGSTAGLTFTYFTDAAGTIALATPNAITTSGTYYIKGTTLGGCASAVMPVVVTVTPVPTVVITNPAAVCAPATVDLTATAVTAGSTPGLTYSYYTNAAGTVVLATPSAVATSGTYYVKGTTLGGCASAVMPVVVSVTPVPTVVITNPAAVCAPATVDLTAAAVTAGSTPGLTYSYYTNAAGTIALATPSAVTIGGTYYIKGTTLGGCTSAVMPVVVTVTPVPIVVITNPAAVCSPATVDLTAAAVTAGSTAGLTYTYFTNAAGTIALVTPAAVATSGTYYIKGTTLGGCVSAVMPVVVTVTPVPTVVITNPAAVCAPATVDLTAAAITAGSTAGLTYTYFTNAAGTVVLATPNAVATSGTYYIKGTTLGGCASAVMPVVVTVTPVPTVVITNPAAVCAPATVDLTAAAVTAGSTPGLTFTYFTDAAGTVILVTPNAIATSGTYYIKGTTLGGCASAVMPVVVTVTPVPTVVITNPAAVCSPATVDITAAVVTVGSTPGLTFSYYTNAAGTVVLAAPNAVATSGTYYIKGTTLGGCTSAVMPVVVTVTPVPTVVITNPAAVCSPATVDITAAAVTAGSTPGLTFTYFSDAAGTLVLATPNAITTSGTYYIKGTTASGCSDIQPVTVTINAKPTVAITNPAAVCSPATVDITAAAVTAGSTVGLTYTYFTDAAGTLVLATPNAITTSGTYYIKGTTASGCSDIQPVTVTINALPVASISYAGSPYCATGTATVTLIGQAGGTYTAPAAVVINAVTGDIDLAASTPGIYVISYTFSNGTCSNTTTANITINALPTATIAYGGSPYCSTGTATVTQAGQGGGTYSSTAGLVINAATGDIDLSASTPNTYTVTYSFTNGTCSNTTTALVTINAKPTVVITNPASVCSPATVDITAAAVTAGSTPGLTFTYFTDAAGTIALATPNAITTSGTYYIKGSTASGCSDIQPVTVTINAKPTVAITNPAPVCSPATVDITAAAVTAGSTPGLTFTYFTDAAGTIALATPNAITTSGTYYIKGSTASGCSDIQPVTVTINAKPAVVITNPAAVCSPATVDITAAAVTAGSTAGLTYTYFTDAAGTIALATPNAITTSGTYYIKGSTASGCSDIQPVTVTINAKPAVVITNPAAVCSPATVDITAAAVTAGSTAGLTYTYFTDAAGTIALATPNAITTSGTYYIKGTTASGCSNIQPVTVTINAKPAVVITNPAAVCSPATVDLTAAAVTAGSTPGLTFTYFTDAAGTLVLATPNAITTSGTYYIKGTTASGCSDIQPVTVTINALPVASISYAGSPYCATGTATVTLSGQAGGTYTAPAAVVINAVTGDIDLAASTPGIYVISYTFTNGTCSNTTTAGITINALPTATIAYGGSPYCSTGTATVTQAGQGGGTYSSTAGLVINASTGDIDLSASTANTYTVTYSFTNGTCSNTTTALVTINAKPAVTITNPAAVCSPATIDITAAAVTAGSTPGLTFTYFTDAAATIALATPNAITTSGTYYIKGSTASGCSDIQPVTVTINAKPAVAITNPAAVCSPATVDITAAAVTAGSTAGLTFTYFTDVAGTIALATPNAITTSGTYYIKGTTASGCSDIQAVTVTINTKPTVVITNPAAVCSPATIDITAAAITAGSTAGLTFTYFTDAAGTIALATPNAITTSGTYYIKGSTASGCSDIQPVTVTINAKPTVAITNPAAVCSPATVDITAATVTAGSTPGLTFTYFTDVAGTIALATPNAITTSGTYYIKGTTASGCSDIQPVTVTINALPTATIIYPGTPYCASGIATVTQAGQSGGNYSSTPGLVINASTGDIDLVASTAGPYTITYTFTNGTCNSSATTSILINALPTATIIYAGAPYCTKGTATVTLIGQAGGTYTAPAAVVINAVTGDIDLAASTPGIYVISYTFTNGTCSNTTTANITINALPTATIAYGGSPYCSTGTATVTQAGQGGGTYSSTAGLVINASTGDIDLSASTANTYTVTYSFTNGTCSNTTTALVTINAKPAVVITNPSALCSPATVDITAAAVTAGSTPGLTFTYFTDAAATIALATPNAITTSGTYYIKGSTASGCSDIQPVTVTINAKPSVVITNPAAVCTPATVDITAAAVTAGSTAGLTYTYFTDAAGTLVLATPNAITTSGTYYIKGTTASGCSDIQPVTVTINAKPTVTITNPAAVCAPATVDLTAAAVTAGSTPGLTFTYFTDAAGTIALATPNAVAASGTYYITGTTAGGCTDIQPVVVTINALPVASISYAGSPYCATGTATVTLTGLAGGFFSAPPAVSINGLTGDVNLAATTPGSYTVVYTFSNGTCSNSASTLISVNPLPVVAITNPVPVCFPASVNLTAAAVTAGSTPGLVYTYFTDAAGTIVLANATAINASGTYYIKGTTGSGCSTIKPVTVTINPQPAATIAYTGSPYCTNGTAFVSLTGVGGGSFASAPGLSLNAVTGDINLATSTQGTYLVVYSFTNGTCSNVATTSVVIKNPALVINNPAGACAPAAIDLTSPSITAGSQTGLTYNYCQDAAGTIPVLNPTAVGTAGTYFVQGVDLITGCSSAIKPVVVTVFAKPVVSASASATDICKGTTITLTAVSPGNTIDWPGVGAGNVVTVTPLDSMVYLAVATAPTGCMDTAVVNVAVKPFTLTLTANPDPVLAGTNTLLTTTGNFTYNVLSWTPSIFFTDQTATTQNIVVKDTSKSFTVIAQSIDGCFDTATLFVTVDPNQKDFFIPNAFSPNGDGNNDVLKVYGSSVRDVVMRIYNQWGELIFETKDVNKGWDGTWKGRPQAVGVYVYVAQVTFYNNATMKRKGTVNLIR